MGSKVAQTEISRITLDSRLGGNEAAARKQKLSVGLSGNPSCKAIVSCSKMDKTEKNKCGLLLGRQPATIREPSAQNQPPQKKVLLLSVKFPARLEGIIGPS